MCSPAPAPIEHPVSPAIAVPRVRIRMYRQGLGDCFLLTFGHDGPQPIHMLVDCGSLGVAGDAPDKVTLAEVVQHIADTTGKHLHLLVVTHEHTDHVSGFNTWEKLFGAEGFVVDRVWAAWTENPGDALAQQVAKFEDDLRVSLQFASDLLRANNLPGPHHQPLHQLGTGLRELLAFDGGPLDAAEQQALGEKPLGAKFARSLNETMHFATHLAGGQEPRYLLPGEVIEEPWLAGVRIYVLGPPRNVDHLREEGEHGSPELYGLLERRAADLAGNVEFHASLLDLPDFAAPLAAEERLKLELGQPFDTCFRLEGASLAHIAGTVAAYEAPPNAWRRIDYDWVAGSDEFALQLNNLTNNTSVALAIELVGDGRVLLLPADAQLGNWQSWDEVKFCVPTADGAGRPVAAQDLLSQTAFYKVGHHASHNATRRPALEAINRPDLVVMIPVDSQVAENKHWNMPEPHLYAELLRRAQGRVLRSDLGLPVDAEHPAATPELAALVTSGRVTVHRLFIDYSLD